MSAIAEHRPSSSPSELDCSPSEPGVGRDLTGLPQRVLRELWQARSMQAVARVVTSAARALVEADGATLALREGEMCFYFDEDASAPLWKGQHFVLHGCVSGWSMQHAEQIAIEDVQGDARVPQAAYRPTFVRGLAVTPVGRAQAMAAIGVYWARARRATRGELTLLQELADTAALAFENVAAHVALERSVAERSEQLCQVHRELDTFAHTVAHDLRSPLSAILGFAELLEDPQSLEDLTQVPLFASEIVLASKRMNALLSALLEFSRSAHVSLDKTTLNLSKRARSAAERLLTNSTVPLVELHIEPGLRVTGDAGLFDVMLTHLLDNAIKYSRKKARPRVEVGKLHDLSRGSTYFVRDNGAGFDPAHSERLFSPFQRLHQEHEGDFPGVGIGLATVARIVHRHDGQVWAEGRVGHGATIYFTLP